MNMVFLKRALGLVSAVVLTGALALAASPVQAADVDARIQALERELAQLKHNQEAANEERALAAEMKMPAFTYAAGKGLTIAAADNNWSINFGQRLQVYSSLWLGNDNPEAGYQNGVIRIRRFRPHINVTSQQGFYDVKWQFSGNTSVAFNGDAYLHFEKTNPWLPTVGYGYNPFFRGNRQQGAGRTEDSLFINALALGGSQDGSVVLSWKKLPAMGISKINHLEVAMGLDQQDEYGRTPGHRTNGRSTAFAFGIQPLAGAKGMGGFDVSSVKYSLGYERLKDLNHGPGNIYGPTTQERVNLVSATLSGYGNEICDAAGKCAYTGKAQGNHTYMVHGLGWSPMKWMSLGFNYATYEADADSGTADDIEATEIRLASTIWLWGPKSGMMGGSKSEGGIYISPLYTSADIKSEDAKATNHGLAVVYNVPGGWMQIHGVWDKLGCEGAGCDQASINKVADKAGDDSFDVFTVIVEYRF